VKKKTANGHARKKYEKFEVRRRKFKESMAEKEYMAQLEEAAKTLPAIKKRETENA